MLRFSLQPFVKAPSQVKHLLRLDGYHYRAFAPHLSTSGLMSKLLQGTALNLKPAFISARFYQIKVFPRRLCRDCYFIRVEGRNHVECRKHGYHKQKEAFDHKLLWSDDVKIRHGKMREPPPKFSGTLAGGVGRATLA